MTWHGPMPNGHSLRSVLFVFFFFSSRRRHTRLQGDWSSDVCSSDLPTMSDDDHEIIGVTMYLERQHAPAFQRWAGDAISALTAGIEPPMPSSSSQIGRASCRERV